MVEIVVADDYLIFLVFLELSRNVRGDGEWIICDPLQPLTVECTLPLFVCVVLEMLLVLLTNHV